MSESVNFPSSFGVEAPDSYYAALPEFNDNGKDYSSEWAELLQGPEEGFPTEASYANHFFKWPHIINGQVRVEFDCTDFRSFQAIPPQAYLAAYRAAKERGEI